MEFTNLTKENIKLFAAGNYSNPGCSSFLEFEEDYLRIKYLKVLIYKLLQNKNVNLRIIINHIICLSNVFPGEATSKILFTELDEDAWNTLGTFLVFLKLMPEFIEQINTKSIELSKIDIDHNLLEKLESL